MQHSHVRKNSWIRFESNRSIRIRKHFWIKVKKLVRFDYQYLQFYLFNFDTVLSSSSLIIQQIVIRSGVKIELVKMEILMMKVGNMTHHYIQKCIQRNGMIASVL